MASISSAKAASPASSARGRGRLGELQRARIVGAMCELVCERGVSDITVAHIVARSRVSRRTFYELFDDRDHCMLATFEHAVQRAAAVVLPAYRLAGCEAGAARTRPAAGSSAGAPAGAWEVRLRAALAALLGFLDEQPTIAQLLVIDALAAPRAVLERRAQVVETLIDAVHQGGARPGHTGPGRRLPRIVAEGAVGAVLSVVHTRLLDTHPAPLSTLVGPLTAMIVLPYRGTDAAERERRLRTPRRRPPAPAPSAPDPLRELQIRLTYRTLRVLRAIAELEAGGAGPSNRQVANAAGVSDAGQISKLLHRLERFGLIANCVERPGRGAAYAWRLTATGGEVERAIRAQTQQRP